MMTAANLGARVTGWGFVVFTIGSLGWVTVGLRSGQTNLWATNAFLTLVNGVGIWRWLGRQRLYEDGGKSAVSASRCANVPSLFTASGLAGMPVVAEDGGRLGSVVEALIKFRTGEVCYVVIASGGVAGAAETLRAVPRDRIDFGHDRFAVRMSRLALDELPPLSNGAWPARQPRVMA